MLRMISRIGINNSEISIILHFIVTEKKPNSKTIIDLIVFTQNASYISSENFHQNICLFHRTVSECEEMFCPGRYCSKSR